MKKINISDIDKLPEPIYVLIAGGIAIGKNHVVREHIKLLPVMDIDDVMEELNHEIYNQANFRQAMAIISDRIDQKMYKRESFVAMGTSANLAFSIERLYNAKRLGYNTAILHITGEVEQALNQNEERKYKNKRYVFGEDLQIIRDTMEQSQESVRVLNKTSLVDYFVEYKNIRNY